MRKRNILLMVLGAGFLLGSCTPFIDPIKPHGTDSNPSVSPTDESTNESTNESSEDTTLDSTEIITDTPHSDPEISNEEALKYLDDLFKENNYPRCGTYDIKIKCGVNLSDQVYKFSKDQYMINNTLNNKVRLEYYDFNQNMVFYTLNGEIIDKLGYDPAHIQGRMNSFYIDYVEYWKVYLTSSMRENDGFNNYICTLDPVKNNFSISFTANHALVVTHYDGNKDYADVEISATIKNGVIDTFRRFFTNGSDEGFYRQNDYEDIKFDPSDPGLINETIK